MNLSNHMYQKADLQYWEKFNSKYELRIEQIAKFTFGITEFRGNQKSIIKCILENNDTFILMRSGGGKSLTFQIPALVSGGVTFIIMPLLSLIYDQIKMLQSLNIKAEEYYKIDTSTSFKDLPKMIFITPEKLYQNDGAIDFVNKLYYNNQIDRFVIDEAHCVALWGNSFRKSYLELSQLKIKYPNVPLVILTATATDQLKSDITSILNMKNPYLFQSSFNRPNLFYDVRQRLSNQDALKEIAYLAKQKYKNQSGIIYCTTRDQTTEICKNLVQQYNISCDIYHASINESARKNTQDMWMQNKIQVLIATIALGMGIDKPDVRFVVHFTLSSSLEHYQQESGRAGRDGKPSDCILFYNGKDKQTILNILSHQGPQFKGEIKTEIFLLTKIINYCENDVICKRKLLINYMGEEFDEKECNNECIICQKQTSKTVVESLNIYEDVVVLLDELSRFLQNGSNRYVTKTQLIDYLTGTFIEEKKKQILMNLKLGDIFKNFGKEKLQKIFNQLQNDCYLYEERKQFKIYSKNGFNPTFSTIKVNEKKQQELKQNQEKTYLFKFNKNSLIMQLQRVQDNYSYENLKERNYTSMPSNLQKNKNANSKVLVPTYLQKKSIISSINNIQKEEKQQLKDEKQEQKKEVIINNSINKSETNNQIEQNDNNNNLKDQLDSILQLDVCNFFKQTESQTGADDHNQNKKIIQKRKSFQDSCQELWGAKNKSNLLLQLSLKTDKQIFNENSGFCNMMQFEQLLEKLKIERKRLYDNFVEACVEKEEFDNIIEIDEFISLKLLKLIIKYLIQDEMQYLKICNKENLNHLNKNYDNQQNFILDNIQIFFNIIDEFQEENKIEKNSYISLEDIVQEEICSPQQQVYQIQQQIEQNSVTATNNIMQQSENELQIEENKEFQKLYQQYNNIDINVMRDDSLFQSGQIKQKMLNQENLDD